MEKDLNDDAIWKKIQQNTFTRWANERLKGSNLKIDNLERDLSDGTILIVLVEVLSQKKIGRYNRNPALRTHRLENVSLALKFLESVEKVHLVNIDSSDIVDQRLKLILGLMWTLILKYSIAIPVYDEHEMLKEKRAEQPPKQRLLTWIQTKIPNAPVTNFTKDWQDGKALGALVDSYAPGLCPDWSNWNKGFALENTTEAMDLADNWLGVPKLIEPQEFINPNVDEMSMMTYLSQYPNAKLKQGAPLQPKMDFSKVRVYGPGVESTNLPLGRPAEFTVEFPQQANGRVAISVQHEAGGTESTDVSFDDRRLHYYFSYTPKIQGTYKVHLSYNGCELGGSPYTVKAEPIPIDFDDVKVSGPGVERQGRVVAQKSTYFEISCGKNQFKECNVIVLDPVGAEHKMRVERIADKNTYRCEFTPEVEGLHSVNIFLDQKPLPNSPFAMQVKARFDARKVEVWGRGLQSKGIRVGDTVTFTVDTRQASDEVGRIEIKIFGPNNDNVALSSSEQFDNWRYAFSYRPREVGHHEVHILYEDQPVLRSPFEVIVAPSSQSKIKAFGPGLEGGVSNLPCLFTVDACGESGSIGFSIEGPSQTAINCEQKEGGSADVTYTPTVAGHYVVHVLCSDEDVPNSPFVADILPEKPEFRPDAVKCSGRGLESAETIEKQPVTFFVDARGAGAAELKVSVIGPDFKFLDNEIIDNGDNTFTCTYRPLQSGRHFIMASYGKVSVPGSPFRVNVEKVVDTSKIELIGPALSDSVRSMEPTHFTINTGPVNPDDFNVQLLDGNGNYVPVELVKINDGQLNAAFTLPKSGLYEMQVLVAGKELGEKPIRIVAEPGVEPSNVKVNDVPKEIAIHSTNALQVDCRLLAHHGCDHLSCLLREPTGRVKPLNVSDNLDGTYKIEYTPTQEGVHELDVFYDKIPVSHSTFTTVPVKSYESTGCSATGPGLKNSLVNTPSNFVVDTKGAGSGKLNVSIEGPSETKVNCVDQKDGSFLVTYVPTAPGNYTIIIRWDQSEIEGSPFNVIVGEPVDVSKVKIAGPGLEPQNVLADTPLTFRVDASGSGAAPLDVRVVPEAEKSPKITDLGNNQYDVVYYVSNASSICELHVIYGGQEIPNSPFLLKVVSPTDKNDVKFVDASGSEQIIPFGEVTAGQPINFAIDATLAKNDNLEVIVTGPDDEPFPVDVLDKGDNLYDISFLPDSAGPYNLVVKYGGRHVGPSPYDFEAKPVGDASKCKITDGVRDVVLTDQDNRIIVDSGEAGPGRLTCRVSPESPATRPYDALRSGDATAIESRVSRDDPAPGRNVITYRIKKPGLYKVAVRFGGEIVPSGEWTVTALTPEQLRVRQLGHDSFDGLKPDFEPLPVAGEHRLASESLHFSSFDGDRRITETSTTTFFEERRRISSDLREKSPNFDQFNQKASNFDQFGQKSPNFDQFNRKSPNFDQINPKSPEFAERRIFDENSLPAEFWNVPIPFQSFGERGDLEAMVKMPSGKRDAPSVKENHDGTVTVRYQPTESGLHEMHILYNRTHVQGSPFQFHVDVIREGHVTAYGSGLSYATVGEPAAFTVCVRDVGPGGLSITVDGPAKADIQCHDNKDGTCSVHWVPPMPGEYKIGVKFADNEIKGSPFVVRVAGEGRKRSHISVGSTSEVALKVSEPDLKGLSASIKSPSGIEEPCAIRVLPDGHLGISFTPREAGEHLVNVKKRGELLPGAPFRINVGENEVGQADKVTLSGPALEQAQTQQDNEFLVNTQKAGFGGLSVSMEGPSKCDIVCKENKDGVCKICYTPTEPGIYVLSVKFADHHVPGSPFTVKCQGPGAGTVSEIVEQKRTPANVALANQECQLYLRVPGANPIDMSAKLTSPSHRTEDVELIDASDNNYLIKFTPKELGLHTISVLHQGNHVSGSPFQFTVGPFQEGGAHKIRAGGPGLHRGEVLVPQSFNIYTREAGAGNLSVAVDGPSKAIIDFTDHKDGNCYVSYTVNKPGEYTVAVKFNDQHVPDSPFKVYVSPSTGESRKLGVAHLPDSGLPVNKPVTFTILTHGAKGHLDAKVITPSKSEDDCYITTIDEGESYAVRFIPKESGYYYVHVRLDGTHMKGSPFRVRVGGKEEPDPAAITVSGDGLKTGETGQKLEFTINTCNAGAGLLSISVDGPSKVTLDAYEVEVGYKVCYTALAPGDYYVTVKYNNVHIPGSPFKAILTGKTIGGSGYNENSTVNLNAVAKTGSAASLSSAPLYNGDASLVECKGVGLKRATVGRQNAFSIDCTRAGEDLLFVAIMTPKGPSEEWSIKRASRGLYNVIYSTKERGTCYVHVRYGSKDVPGSPFPVEV